jgi:RNA polymerase sigma-70 factor (ECF subfamily)
MTAAARATCDEEDLVQEVLSALVEHRHRFVYDGPGSLRRWAAGILRHKIADAGRRRTALPASLLSPRTAKGNGSSVPGGLIDALVASQAGASHVALKRELEDKVSAVLESLSDDLREVLLLKMYEELSGREIAQQLSLDESTISKRIRRALETCRSRLGEDAA